MKFFQDLLTLLSGFGLVDYILYFSVLALIILVVSLIYVIKNENRESDEVEMKREENLDMFVNSKNDSEDEEIDLQEIMENINEKPEPLVDMTAYENEQEQKAIISYDELVNYNRNQINYDQEELVDDVIPVKRIQSSTLELPKKLDEIQTFELPEREPKLEVDSKSVEEKLFSYEKEEAFLKALKELNSLLN